MNEPAAAAWDGPSAMVRQFLVRADDTIRSGSADGLPRLVPTRPATDAGPLLRRLAPLDAEAESGSAARGLAAVALQAGLLLVHDLLDESHALSQGIEGQRAEQLGDYWHGILHRREPDYANAKYWFRALGRHSIFQPLAEQATIVLRRSGEPAAPRWDARLCPAAGWDPFAFIDLCESCAADEGAPLALAARRVQLAELRLLLDLTHRTYCSSGPD